VKSVSLHPQGEQPDAPDSSAGQGERLEDFRQPVTAEPKGVLDPALAAQRFRLARYEPAADLRSFVEHFWIVAWDLRGQEPYVQKTLPYPCVHLVFDAGRTAIFGVMRGAFEYRLEGAGRVLGVRFRAGGFRGVLGGAVATLTDRTIPLSGVYELDCDAAEASVLGAEGDAGMMQAAEVILRTRIPPADEAVGLVGGIVDRIGADRTINRVDELATQAGMGERALQRLFGEYVGVSPKWVIRRFRLHDAASRLAKAEDVNLTHLAQELGYSDQAHFTRDFKAIVGRSPSDYRRLATSVEAGGLTGLGGRPN
jgi:AraC-like DNA-binding protein